MMHKLIKWFLIGLVGVAILLWVSARITLGQGLPPEPKTTFTQHCYRVASDGLTVYFGYEATGGDHWIGSGFDFVTLPGKNPDALNLFVPSQVMPPDMPVLGFGRLVIYSDPAMKAFDGVVETVHITFDLSKLPACANAPAPASLPIIATPAPTPAPCPAWSILAATGDRICLYDLPYFNGG